jgi:hypothetical protein
VKVSSTIPAFELTFEPVPAGYPREVGDVVHVHRTESLGSGGHPIYVDAGGTVRAEISDRGEVRMIATSARQVLRRPVLCRPASCRGAACPAHAESAPPRESARVRKALGRRPGASGTARREPLYGVG